MIYLSVEYFLEKFINLQILDFLTYFNQLLFNYLQFLKLDFQVIRKHYFIKFSNYFYDFIGQNIFLTNYNQNILFLNFQVIEMFIHLF